MDIEHQLEQPFLHYGTNTYIDGQPTSSASQELIHPYHTSATTQVGECTKLKPLPLRAKSKQISLRIDHQVDFYFTTFSSSLNKELL